MKLKKKISIKTTLRVIIILALFILGFGNLLIMEEPNIIYSSPLLIALVLSYPSKNVVIKRIGCVYAILFIMLIKLDFIGFEFMPQAKVLLDTSDNVFYWFSVGHVHAVRLLVSYPGYLISEIYNIPLHLGFTYYGMVLFLFMYVNMANTIETLKCKKSRFSLAIRCILLTVPLLILPLVMNGRIVLAFFGYSVLVRLYTQLFWGSAMSKPKVFIVTFIGFLMTMVSSGTMVVGLLYIITMLYSINYDNLNKVKFIPKIIAVVILLSPLIYKIMDYTWVMINRNLTFYGGGFKGFFKMLDHGLGKYFNSSLNILVIFFAFMGMIFVVLNYKIIKNMIKNKSKFLPLLLAVNIGFFGLFFGFSTGMMMIPPLLVIILIKL